MKINDSTSVRPEKPHVFGPVPSRRLGRSLGVDLVPYKTCSYDCIYCQLGRTTNKTIERKEWLPMDLILRQLKGKLSQQPDYITLSGSGEPTLYSRCDELIERIKGMTDVPVAVLTNGSLLWMAQVRKSLLAADLVIPSLDAGNEALFQYINRPHKDICFTKMLEGLIAFRQTYSRQYWLEVFLTAGVSTTDKEIEHLRAAIEKISPDKVQINTVSRPPAEHFAEPVPKRQLESVAQRISAQAEIIADYGQVHQKYGYSAHQQDILSLLQRRPCTVDDIANGLGLHPNEVVKYIHHLLSEQQITATHTKRKTYYVCSNKGY